MAEGQAGIRFALALMAVACGLGCSPAPRPNVLLVTIDTLRSDHTSAYGYIRDTTPNLRELAYAGARFEDAYAPTSTTAPTHASLFTGLYPVTHRVVKNGILLGGDHRTLAERLSEAGYQTAAIASSYVLSGKFGFRRGFDLYEDDFAVETSTLRFEGHRAPFDRRADETTQRALRWLRDGRDPARPFFLFVHYFDPHAPYRPPWPFDERFGDGAGMGLIENEIRLYDSEILYTDSELGRLLDALDEDGLAENTLVVITADHGEGLMDHGHLRHGIQVYEESVRVPFLVRWPGRIQAGRSIDGPVELVDLLPTILDLVGIASEEDLPGRSLAPALREGEALAAERPVYLFRRHYQPGKVTGFDVAGEQHAVVEGDWKYIEAPEEKTRELYDLRRDPGERVNQAEALRARAESLRSRLADFRREHERSEAPARVADEDRGALEALGYVE